MIKAFVSIFCSIIGALTLVLTILQGWAVIPITYKNAGRLLFTVNPPAFWSVRIGGPRELSSDGQDARTVSRLVGMHPVSEPRVWVGFVSPQGVRNFDDATEYLQEIGPFLVKELQIDSRKSHEIGGRPAKSIAGHGKRKGKSVNSTAVLIDLPNERMAISVTVMEAGADPSIVMDVNAIPSEMTGGRMMINMQ
jgi:hypothetical protein